MKILAKIKLIIKIIKPINGQKNTVYHSPIKLIPKYMLERKTTGSTCG